MLLTKESFFNDFWYPVMPLAQLSAGPQSFTLLGQQLVLWLDQQGEVSVLQDRCAHRSAKLSKGWVCDGAIVCPYHAWAYNKTGKCIHFPQGHEVIPATYQVPAFATKQKYGYVWVCLGKPQRDIPEFPEANLQHYRFIDCFYETWKTMSLRVVENELDMAHFAVVHRGTFGNPQQPLPLSLTVTEVDDFTVQVDSVLSVCVPEQQQKNTGVTLTHPQETSTRTMQVTWFMPFTIKLSITYPSGLHHVIINHPTPIDDNHIQVVQFCFRNDTEAEVTREDLLQFERKILNEDRAVLETTDYHFPLLSDMPEAHMPTDKAGILVRKKILKMMQRKAP